MALSGDYNRKVIFKAPTTIKNDEGGEEVTYPDNTVETWAKIKRTNQVRALEANSTALINSDIVTIRYTEGRLAIEEDWLVSYNGVDHVIQSINPESKTEIVFIVKGKVGSVAILES